MWSFPDSTFFQTASAKISRCSIYVVGFQRRSTYWYLSTFLGIVGCLSKSQTSPSYTCWGESSQPALQSYSQVTILLQTLISSAKCASQLRSGLDLHLETHNSQNITLKRMNLKTHDYQLYGKCKKCKAQYECCLSKTWSSTLNVRLSISPDILSLIQRRPN